MFLCCVKKELCTCGLIYEKPRIKDKDVKIQICQFTHSMPHKKYIYGKHIWQNLKIPTYYVLFVNTISEFKNVWMDCFDNLMNKFRLFLSLYVYPQPSNIVIGFHFHFTFTYFLIRYREQSMLHGNGNGNAETKHFGNEKRFFLKIKDYKRFGNVYTHSYIYIYIYI